MSKTHAEFFATLFRGNENAHGLWTPVPSDADVAKKDGKSVTIREPVTVKMWEDHINGVAALGIVPITEASNCYWGVIDVDIYPVDFEALLTKIELMHLPLICCKSKSEGAHLFVFFNEPEPAPDVRKLLDHWKSQLSLAGNTEVFPKQSRIITARNDVGNWLNMPYFGNSRKAIILTRGRVIELDIDGFIYLIERLPKAPIAAIKGTNGKVDDLTKSVLQEAPPCLQTLQLNGFPVHTRNEGLFGLGVYAKKAFPGEWQQKVEGYNRTLFKQPLKADEVVTIIKSLSGKDYFYRCHEEPMVSHCNSQLCRTRRFGISNVASMPIINSVTKLLGEIVIWFIDVEGGRLELTTDELFDEIQFRKKCMSVLNVLPHAVPKTAWTAYIQKLLQTAIIVEPPEDSTGKEMIWSHLYQYAKAKISNNPLDIENDRSYYDKNNAKIHFKFKSFMNFLSRKRVQMPRNLITAYLKEHGFKEERTTVGGKTVRFHSVQHLDTNNELLFKKDTGEDDTI